MNYKRAILGNTVLLTTHARTPKSTPRSALPDGWALCRRKPTTFMTNNSRAVDIIAAALPTLTHPGDANSGPLALPVAAMRMDTTLPPDVAEHFAKEAGYPHADIARLFAEAIVNVIESAGLSINDAAEVTRLRTVAEPIPALRQVEVHCHCGTNLFGLQVHNAETDKPTVAGPALIKAVSQLGTECATGHRG